MKKIRFCLVLLAVFAIMGGTAFAWNETEHVKIAPNGEGDLIFFPWYLAAGGGWQTQISVINTSSNHMAVAKVIVRSHNWSDELLDFLIFLSPNDVWTGYVRYGAQGAYIYSDDDSILVSKPAICDIKATDVPTYFASPTNPVSQPFFAANCAAASKIDGKTDSNDFGYIEVIEAASTTVTEGKKTKDVVYKWYCGLSSPNPDDLPTNILTGYHEFQNTQTGSYSALARAQVYSDWKNKALLNSSDASGLINGSDNTIGELEAAMAKTAVAMPYVWKGAAATLHFFTFPTKLSYNYRTASATTPCDTYDKTASTKTLSDFWGRETATKPHDKCLVYKSTGFDLLENTVTTGPFSGGGTTLKMCEEMQWIPAYIPGDLFTEGWIRYDMDTDTASTQFRFLSSTTLYGRYYGVPVLSSALYIRAASVSEADAAWTQSNVLVPDATGGHVYHYYQYADRIMD